MSFCLMYCIGDELYVGADSRKSIKENGAIRSMGDNLTKKIIACDKHILFTAGRCSVYEELLKRAKQYDETPGNEIHIEDICRIAKDLPKSIDKDTMLGTITCQMFEGEPVATIMQESDNYYPYTRTFTDGEYSALGFSVFEDNAEFLANANRWIEIYKASHRINPSTVMQFYEDFYNHIQSEAIGGTISIYKVSKAGTQFVGEVTTTPGFGHWGLMTIGKDYAKFDGVVFASNLKKSKGLKT